MFPRPSPRSITRQQVQERLKSLPDVRQLKELQTSQQRIETTDAASTKLKAFCQCAGEPLIRAFEIIESLRKNMETASSDKSGTFCSYQSFQDALIEIRQAHAVWEVSVGDEVFGKGQASPRAMRFEWLWYMLVVVYTLSDLTFPDEFHATYLDEFKTLLGRQDWRDQLILDSDVTYELSRKRAIPGTIAPPERYPRRFLNHGQAELRPFLIHSTSVYGHRLLPNVRSLRQRSCMLMMRLSPSQVHTAPDPPEDYLFTYSIALLMDFQADPPNVFLNMGRLNDWDTEQQ